MTLTVNGQAAEPGCYVDGHWGQYGSDHFADQLEGFGLVIPKLADARRATAVMNWCDERSASYSSPLGNVGFMAAEWHSDSYDWLLNLANEATEGGYWEWYDGECFLRSYICPECGRDAREPDVEPVGTLPPCDFCCDADDPGCFA